MNCQEALNLLYEIIDKEASDIDAAQVREHLGNCRHCFEVYRLESAVNDLLTEKVKAAASPRSLDGVEAIRGKLLAQLDQIDTETRREPAPTNRKPFGNIAMTLGIAASLIVILGAAFVGRDLIRHREVFMPLEQAHWRVENNVEIPSDHSLTAERIRALADSIHLSLAQQVGEFTLVSGHVEELLGVRMGHFVYENEKQMISVFAAPAAQFNIPDDVRDNVVSSDGVQYFSHNCRGCRLLFVRDGEWVLVAATTDKNLDMTTFLRHHRVA
ncbi:MAG: zf-HC2 domain-containing protein [candidate division Zixibacteria bacterium]|nr:zf-HC2 domain-containing protein [candidate division Zixibacteria bacterium]